MLTRRELLANSARLGTRALALPAAQRQAGADEAGGVLVNDMQSQLNETRVARVVKPETLDVPQDAIRAARRDGKAVSVAGGRHSMGGQPFGSDAVLIDTTGLNKILALDSMNGEVEVQAGIEWPELIEMLRAIQEGEPRVWTIRQKQTGLDRVSIGGSLASHIHGPGLPCRRS